MPDGRVVTAQRDTLAEMSAAFGCCVPAGVSGESDALALMEGAYPPIYVRDIGLIVFYSEVVITKDVGDLVPYCVRPVTPIANEGYPKPLSLTTTNQGEVFEAGTPQMLTWQRDTEVVGPDVRIGLHQGAAFVDWIVRRTDNDGEYTWTIPPDLLPGNNYRLRIQSYTDSSIRDYSDGPFSIATPALVLTSPNGGELWRAIFEQTISWVSDPSLGGADVRLGLHRGAAFVGWITRRTANDGEYHWIIPEGLPSASNYRVRVQSFSDSSIRDYSDRRFVIVQWPR